MKNKELRHGDGAIELRKTFSKERIMSERKIPVECWTRVVGYFRPTKDCNLGKRAEISDRKTFDANAYFKRELQEVK